MGNQWVRLGWLFSCWHCLFLFYDIQTKQIISRLFTIVVWKFHTSFIPHPWFSESRNNFLEDYPIRLCLLAETLNKDIQDNWGISGSVSGGYNLYNTVCFWSTSIISSYFFLNCENQQKCHTRCLTCHTRIDENRVLNCLVIIP